MWTWPATEIARAVTAGEVSAREVVDSHLDRIAEVNPAVNAVTVVRADEARAAADAPPVGRLRAAGAVPIGHSNMLTPVEPAFTAGVPA